jgi:hypothetical protein
MWWAKGSRIVRIGFHAPAPRAAEVRRSGQEGRRRMSGWIECAET